MPSILHPLSLASNSPARLGASALMPLDTAQVVTANIGGDRVALILDPDSLVRGPRG